MEAGMDLVGLSSDIAKSRVYEAAKRALDVLVSMVALVFASAATLYDEKLGRARVEGGGVFV